MSHDLFYIILFTEDFEKDENMN